MASTYLAAQWFDRERVRKGLVGVYRNLNTMLPSFRVRSWGFMKAYFVQKYLMNAYLIPVGLIPRHFEIIWIWSSVSYRCFVDVIGMPKYVL